MKVQEVRNEENNKRAMIENNKNMVKEILRTMIEKSDKTNLIEQMNYLIDNDFYIDLDRHVRCGDDLMGICNKLLIDIENKAQSIYEINDLLKKHYKRQYNKYMKAMRKESNIYKECIEFCSRDTNISIEEQKIKLLQLFDELERDYNTEQRYNRSNKIQKLLKSNNKDIRSSDDFYPLICANAKYKQYVDGILSQLTLDQIVEKIGKSVRKKIEKSNRKNKLDDQIEKKISNEYIVAVKDTDIYRDYVDQNKGDIDNVINELVAVMVKLEQEKQEKREKQERQKLQKENLPRLAKNGIDVDNLHKIINEFDKCDEKELLLYDYHGEELQFFHSLCKEKGYIYKRLNYNKISITK